MFTPIVIKTNWSWGVSLKRMKEIHFSRRFAAEVNVVCMLLCRKVQVGKDQEKAQSEKDSHSKNRGGKTTN